MTEQRKMLAVIGVGDRAYVPGEEEELYAVLSEAEAAEYQTRRMLAGDWSGSGGGALPPVVRLEAHLSSLNSVEEVEALAARDDRKTAQPLYEARIAELGG